MQRFFRFFMLYLYVLFFGTLKYFDAEGRVVRLNPIETFRYSWFYSQPSYWR